MEPLFLLFGGVLGFVFSVPLISGVVWCVQIAINRGWLAGLSAGLGIALAQTLWANLAAFLIFQLAPYSDRYNWAFRFLAAIILLSMSFRVFQIGKIESLAYKGSLVDANAIFRRTFIIALAMPMRFLGYLALLVAMSLHLRVQPIVNGFLLAIGVGAGSFLWWLCFVTLAALFGKRVPEPITIRSLNKLRFLGAAVLLGVMFIGTVPLVVSMK